MKSRLAVYCLSALASGTALAGAVIRAVPNGSSGNSGLSWTEATSLDHALAVAAAGDEIWLKQGTYFPGGGAVNVDVTFSVPAGVSVFGGFAGTETARSQRNIAAHPTVLSGDLAGDDVTPSTYFGQYDPGIRGTNVWNVVTVTGGSAAQVLDGFEVRGGGMKMTGGRISLTNLLCTAGRATAANDCTALQISHCVFRSNMINGALLITNCADCTVEYSAFYLNRAGGGGGAGAAGFYGGGTVTLRACDFAGNSASSSGAGIQANGLAHLDISACRFNYHNLNAEETQIGAALSASDIPDIKIRVAEFQHNSADDGGAVNLTHCTASLDRVQFNNNSESQLRATRSIVTLSNVTFTGEDSALTAQDESSLSVLNSTFTVPVAGVRRGSSATFRNCILAHSGPMLDVDPDSTLVVSHSIVTGGAPGEGNLDADPLFIGPASIMRGPDGIPGTSDDVPPNLRLQPGSPAINSGSPGPPLPLVDLDGLSRQIGTVDRGAYEFAAEREKFDRDSDGQPDIFESAAGTDPFNPGDIFRLNPSAGDGLFRLQWQPVAGRTYTVQSGSDLASWTDTAVSRGANSGLFETPLAGRGFHRVRVWHGY